MTEKISKQEEERYEQLQLMALDFARAGNTRELETMIDYGLSVNLCTHKNDTLVMLSSYNGHVETTHMLIRKGADINRRNMRGQTPLDGVCFKGNLQMVKLLVENGADITGNPIIFATIFGNKDIIEYLKKRGLDEKSLKIYGISVDFLSSVTAYLKSIFFNRKKKTKIKSNAIQTIQ